MRRTSWRPSYAAPTWQALWVQMHATMADRAKRPAVKAARGAAVITRDPAPPLTNAEAIAFIRVWRGATTSDGPLWYQFAARAYGWNPPSRDTLRVDDAQAQAEYPDPTELWRWSKNIATELDERKLGVPASLAPNKAAFGDPTFYADVRARLIGDGANATIATNQRPVVVRAVTRDSGYGWLAIVAIAAMVLSDKRRATGRRNRS